MQGSTAHATSVASGRIPHMGRALRSRNFRLYIVGQGISLIGSWMTRLALSWLTYRLTHSALLLGLVGFAGQILTFLLAPFAGAFDGFHQIEAVAPAPEGPWQNAAVSIAPATSSRCLFRGPSTAAIAARISAVASARGCRC